MAFEFGSFSQYDDSVTIADPTIATAASVIQLPAFKGALWQAMGAPEVPFSGINTVDFEIYNRSKNVRTGTVRVDWDATQTVGLEINEGLANGITVGQILKIESEYVIVKEVTARGASATIDVWARGAGGTTGAIHTANTPITAGGYAANDSDLKNVESVYETSAKYTNYMQLIFETIDWEERGDQLLRKGMSGDMVEQYLVKEAALRLAENLAISPIEGLKQVGAKGSSPYMSAGIIAQLQDDAGGGRPILTSNVGGAFDEPALITALDEVMQVGKPVDIWMNVKNKSTFNGFNYAKTALDVVTDKSDKTAGQTLDYYSYENYIFNVRVDADLPNDKVLILDTPKCWKGWNVDDPLRRQEEPKLSSREHRESLQGSYGMGVDGVGYDHILMYGIV